MEDYDEVASQDEWESVDGEEEEEDAGEFNEVDDDNIAETSYNPRVKKRKVDEDECEESYEMNPRKKKEWDQQAESDAASSASRLPVFDDGILKSNKTPLVVDRGKQ